MDEEGRTCVLMADSIGFAAPLALYRSNLVFGVDVVANQEFESKFLADHSAVVGLVSCDLGVVMAAMDQGIRSWLRTGGDDRDGGRLV